MKAQTYLDVVRGLDMVSDRLWKVLHREDQKAEIATDEGALALLGQIDQITETLRRVIDHDSGSPITFTLISQ